MTIKRRIGRLCERLQPGAVYAVVEVLEDGRRRLIDVQTGDEVLDGGRVVIVEVLRGVSIRDL